MDVSKFDFLAVDGREGYVVARFNRPDNRNMWARSEEYELEALVTAVDADSDIKALVLTGSGDVFSGGAHHSDDPFDGFDYYDRSRSMFGAFMNLDKPIIVAVNGPATGSGLTLAMLGDIVVAERHVQFGDAHVVAGVVSATGSFLWPPSIGLLRAKRYLLTGEFFSADEAERLGLVSEVVDSGRGLVRAEEHAARIASLPPEGVQGTKRALNRWLKTAFEPIFEHGLSLEFMRFPVARMDYGSGVSSDRDH
jgi:enoyl-CoA hydratase/carnithine racemase